MIHLHRAERADLLATAIRELLRQPQADPMAPEVVSVPTRGIERWLSQRLAGDLGASDGRGDGVCTNVHFPFPGRLVGDALAAGSGVDADADPWLADRAVWPLLEVVDGCLTEPWLATLAAYLGAGEADGDSGRGARRFSSVRHIADLLDGYGVHRPEMLRAWAAGEDTDGSGRPLPEDLAWQAELWRRLRARVGIPSPAERLPGACARLRGDGSLVDLPERIALFGLTRLPASYLDVLAALADHREVHLYLLHPSPALWDRLAALPGAAGPVRRAEDPTAELTSHPLLASWGRDAREMQLVLAGQPHREEHHPLHQEAATLLARIQADVRADRPPPGAPLPGRADERPPLSPADRSLQIHACHGRGRQVEVVRDAILHALADDPTLEPRDLLVMCPDVEAFAPLVHAIFGGGAADDEAVGTEERTPDLRVRLADRSLRQTNPLLGTVAQLLDLASSRLTASEVLDLAAREPVRRRFDLDDDELSRLDRWADEAGVRWGLDAAHRAPYRLEAVAANTWEAGLDRLLAGVAMAEDEGRLVGGVLPLDDVESGAIDLAGRLAELLGRLEVVLDDLAEPKPVAEWARSLSAAADALCAVSERDAWQRAQLERLLDDVVRESSAGGAGAGTRLALPEVRSLLGDRLRGRPTRANFRTGHLTVCTLVPMRSVPHRMICLMGLDDGAFPRQGARDGDDIIARDPRVGDRDVRGEDRQLLLDALLAASERLVVAYTGRDERTNEERPPAVPVGELLDVVDATVRTAAGERARDRVVLHHPLQPFDPRNFSDGALGREGPWGFDRAALEGARALVAPRTDPAPFLAAPLEPVGGDAVALEDLARFVRHPVRAFLRGRLGIALAGAGREGDDALPIDPDGLVRWEIGARLLAAGLRGRPPAESREVELARGALPPGTLAEPVLARIEEQVEGVLRAARPLQGLVGTRSVEVEVALPDGRVLLGTVSGVSGDLVGSANFSRLGPGHRLAGWVRFLALCAGDPERPWRSALVGRDRLGAPGRAAASVSAIGPLPGDPEARRDAALGHLAALVDLHDRGMREPLPLFSRTSAAYAAAARAGEDPRSAAQAVWESEWSRPGEEQDAEHRLVLGPLCFDDLLAIPPRPDESGAGWPTDEATRLGRCARRLWDGLLSVEELTDL